MRRVGAFAEERVAAHAVILLPDALSGGDGRRDVLFTSLVWDFEMRVETEDEEDAEENGGPPEEEDFGLELG